MAPEEIGEKYTTTDLRVLSSLACREVRQRFGRYAFATTTFAYTPTSDGLLFYPAELAKEGHLNTSNPMKSAYMVYVPHGKLEEWIEVEKDLIIGRLSLLESQRRLRILSVPLGDLDAVQDAYLGGPEKFKGFTEKYMKFSPIRLRRETGHLDIPVKLEERMRASRPNTSVTFLFPTLTKDEHQLEYGPRILLSQVRLADKVQTGELERKDARVVKDIILGEYMRLQQTIVEPLTDHLLSFEISHTPGPTRLIQRTTWEELERF